MLPMISLLFGLPFLPFMTLSFAALVAAIALALVMRKFMPEQLASMGAAIADGPGATMMRGALGAFGAALVGILLFVSVVGAPVAFIIFGLLSLASYVGLAVGLSVLGAALPFESLRGKPTRQLVAGATTLFIIAQVPVIGWAFGAALVFAGLGALKARKLHSIGAGL